MQFSTYVGLLALALNIVVAVVMSLALPAGRPVRTRLALYRSGGSER